MVARLNCSPQHRNSKATATAQRKSSHRNRRMRQMYISRAHHTLSHTAKEYIDAWRNMTHIIWFSMNDKQNAVRVNEMNRVILFWILKRLHSFVLFFIEPFHTCGCVQCALLASSFQPMTESQFKRMESYACHCLRILHSVGSI